MKILSKKNNGITLVALVITIIILLILATISIQALTQTGLFQKANEAKEKMQNAEENQAKILNEYEDELNKYISGNVKIPEKIIDVEQGAESHISGVISYSWSELSAIAQKISDNVDISSNTAEVKVTLNGTVKSLGVGDIATVDGKTVRILGFNQLRSERFPKGPKAAGAHDRCAFGRKSFVCGLASPIVRTANQTRTLCVLKQWFSVLTLCAPTHGFSNKCLFCHVHRRLST